LLKMDSNFIIKFKRLSQDAQQVSKYLSMAFMSAMKRV